MALTVKTAINRVKGRLNEQGVEVILPPDVERLIPDALRRFALLVNSSAEMSPLLRKDFSIVVASGVGSLTASLTAAEPLLAECLPNAHLVASTNTTPMQYLPDRFQLSLSRPLGFFIYFCNDQGTLRTRNTDGSLTSLNTTVTATAQYIPTIGNVPTQLEDLFITTLADMIKTAIQETGAEVA